MTYIKQFPFDYHLGLHYSQTDATEDVLITKFDYHLGLHYSQTMRGG